MLQTGLISIRLMFFFAYLLLCGLGPAGAADAQVHIKLLLTSNIQGRSMLAMENQAHLDPLLVLAQNILAEHKTGADLYLDLGNAFYPGVISKFSSGSIMMDFLDGFGCAATLVSSKDLRVGVKNLEHLQKSRTVRLLSANIARPTGTVFTPFVISEVRGLRIAFVAISSKRLEFDIAEKDLYGIGLKDEMEALEPVVNEIRTAGVNHIILLTGLKVETVMRLLDAFPQIGLALCGGDSTGTLYDGKASRIDLADGRSILMMDDRFDYYTVDLSMDKGMHPLTLRPHKAVPLETDDISYLQFIDRLALWKTKYLAEQSHQVAEAGDGQYVLDDVRLAQLLRDRFNSEIAIVDTNTINSYPITRDIRRSDLLGLVNLDYNVFTFVLRGHELRFLHQNHSNLVLVGLSPGKLITVQGYPVEDHRNYKVAATQPAFEKVQRLLGKNMAFKNSWTTVTDLLVEDLKHERVTLRKDYAYLERRYRTLFDVYLSNFVASGDVHRSGSVATPVDQPAQSYSRWGLEDRIDWTLYNQNHRFVLTPYLFYLRQDDEYIQNLLRGTLLYEYNLSESLRPYNKFQIDTVVEDIAGERPILIRETMGVSAYFNHLSGRLGLGFEKKIQDPAEDALFGLEVILGFRYPFFKHFTYLFEIDNFASIRTRDGGQLGLRSSIDNALAIRINDYLSLSLKHKYFYLHEDELDADYRSSQIFTTVDLITNLKIW
ncbi:MAG: hypothetical protein C4519_07810 [Desulfobacteraceae bacterium]|nr:MAG: hypothetical protein C4519_07810 [Desulfobacteraceae bacterium]